MFRKILLASAGLAVLGLIGLAGFAWWSLQPKHEPLSLPDGLIAASDSIGVRLLRDADAKADYVQLSEHFESQELRSFCGVASSVAVLNSLGRDLDQSTFFDLEANELKSRLGVILSGMTLADLASFLMAHNTTAKVQHADSVSIEELRKIVRENLQNPDDFLLVNYQREVLGQRRVGHISPVAAYDDESDRVLILDTAAYNYPPTWVPLTRLYAAMNTTDPSSGKARGLVEVSSGRH